MRIPIPHTYAESCPENHWEISRRGLDTGRRGPQGEAVCIGEEVQKQIRPNRVLTISCNPSIQSRSRGALGGPDMPRIGTANATERIRKRGAVMWSVQVAWLPHVLLCDSVQSILWLVVGYWCRIDLPPDTQESAPVRE